jgi:hydrogenase-1 operon protein HyaE
VTQSTSATSPPAPARPRHPLIERLFGEFGYAEVTADTIDTFVQRPGHTLLFFGADPQQYGETLDLAVIVPELVAAFATHPGGPMTVGVLLPAAARALAPRYGFRRWPAIVLLRGGGYVGAIDGLRDWSDYITELARLLDAPVTRPPTVGIAVRAVDDPGSHCH